MSQYHATNDGRHSVRRKLRHWLLCGIALIGSAAPVHALTVHEVRHASQADIKVYRVQRASQADLRIHWTKYRHQAKGDALWFREHHASGADVKIYYVDRPGQADIKVFEVGWQGQAGWNGVARGLGIR